MLNLWVTLYEMIIFNYLFRGMTVKYMRRVTLNDNIYHEAIIYYDVQYVWIHSLHVNSMYILI